MIDPVEAALSGSLIGFGVGLWMSTLFTGPPPDEEHIRNYMNKVVNAEEAQERYNLTRKMLHDANRRTMPRADSAEPAKVYRMRRRRVKRSPESVSGRENED